MSWTRTELRAGCGIDFDHLRFAGQCNRDLLHNRVLNLARPTPGHPEFSEDRSLRLQNFRPEVAFCDLDRQCLVPARIHFSVLSSLQISFRHDACQRPPICVDAFASATYGLLGLGRGSVVKPNVQKTGPLGQWQLSVSARGFPASPTLPPPIPHLHYTVTTPYPPRILTVVPSNRLLEVLR